MVEFSNRAIVVLLVLSLSISLVGTFLSINVIQDIGGRVLGGGAATATNTFSLIGTTSLSTSSNNSVTIVAGYVNSSCDLAYYRTDGVVFNKNITSGANSATPCWLNSTDIINVTNHSAFHTIENDGDYPAIVTATVTSDSNAETSICGTALCVDTSTARWQIKSTNQESDSCESGTALDTFTVIADHTATYSPQLCAHLDHRDSQDTIEASFNATIPYDALTGGRTFSVTYTATDATT
jgi:hypothetical protein